MQIIKVLQGQSLLDLALQATGSIDAIVDIATINNVSITAELPIDTEIKNSGVIDYNAVNFFTPKNKRPATAYIYGFLQNEPQGIGHWAVGVDFIIT